MRVKGSFELELSHPIGTRVTDPDFGLGTVREIDFTWQGTMPAALLGVTVEWDDGSQENYTADELADLAVVA